MRSALDKLASSEIARVRIHASHAGYLREQLERIRPETQIEIVADAALRPGSVLFETARGTLDVSAETQLKEIERGFTDVLHRRH